MSLPGQSNSKFRRMAQHVSFFIVILLNFLVHAQEESATRPYDYREQIVVKICNNCSLVRLNDTTDNSNSIDSKNSSLRVIDCLGFGEPIAQLLAWWFTVNGDSANSRDVRFFLTSRKQPRRVQVLAGEQFGLEWTDFKIERRTVIIVHGFLSHGDTSWVKRMEEAFLLWDDVNVVVVDWAARGNTLNYYKAVVNTRIVGNEIARLLHHIVNATIAATSSNETKWGKLHLVGHSLGAHICGFAASEFKKRQDKWHVARITGLDPALPCFNNVTSIMRLDRNDAQFVDVIHTNGKLEALFGFGSPQSIGHVDYYPNGGKTQPGCEPVDPSFIDFIAIPKPLLNQAVCSHGRSYLYLIDSLISASSNNCTFWAQHWDRSYRRALQLLSENCGVNNCTEMGIKAENHPQRGTFFVVTSKTSPFCATTSKDREELREQLKVDYANEILD